ncbi:hypothetical protein CANCADRAFT_103971 [Tortispora caseinolytica NRRL Y-17796]|uniref:Rab-GAP TBC domain-containing protein n=1 Tax=Tortispora caseinolytica NRRL Y-17796 TaxID=767744 RepID=A0A1E4TF04_9ASCO|nr:hypothetical protein CANCADRAFT_103971 [Tortispora caseinolytica NRRL Y-17796]
MPYTPNLNALISQNDELKDDYDRQVIFVQSCLSQVHPKHNTGYDECKRILEDICTSSDADSDKSLFWQLVEKDYPAAVTVLPYLVCSSIHADVPSNVRAACWKALSGCTERDFTVLYDLLNTEPTKFESLITRDLHRTFPQVDECKDPEFQRKLGRVLRAFSVYDPDVGYCQGMSFIVAPLLMVLDEQTSFAVLVQIMESYDIRSSYTATMAGLDVRLFQLENLMARELPELYAHFADLGIDFTYAAGWFLTLFCTTCPLNIVFRLYDLYLSEGIPETIIRVALCLLKRNQTILLDVMLHEELLQRLYSASIWDVYGSDGAEKLIKDLEELTSLVTVNTLDELEDTLRESQMQKALSSQTNSTVNGDSQSRPLVLRVKSGFVSMSQNALNTAMRLTARDESARSSVVSIPSLAGGVSMRPSLSNSVTDTPSITEECPSAPKTDKEEELGLVLNAVQGEYQDLSEKFSSYRVEVEKEREVMAGLLLDIQNVLHENNEDQMDEMNVKLDLAMKKLSVNEDEKIRREIETQKDLHKQMEDLQQENEVHQENNRLLKREVRDLTLEVKGLKDLLQLTRQQLQEVLRTRRHSSSTVSGQNELREFSLTRQRSARNSTSAKGSSNRTSVIF